MPALDRPAVSAASESFFDALVEGPAMEQRADALLGRFSANAEINSALTSISERIALSPALQKSLAKLAADHPDANDDEIDALLDKQYDANWDSPSVTAAFTAEWNSFSDRLDDDPAVGFAFGRLLGPHVERFNADETRTKTWSARLRKLGGDDISDERATKLYLERVWSPERTEKLLVTLLSNQTVRTASRQAFADILGVEAVVDELEHSSVQLLSRPELVDVTTELLELLFSVDPEVAQIQKRLNRFLQNPATLAAARRVLILLTKDPEVAKIGSTWLEAVKRDRELMAQVDDFFDNW